jgi:acyl-CoA dehydrogenase
LRGQEKASVVAVEFDEFGVRPKGSKTFITNGGQADLTIVVAKTDPADGAKGVSLILVEGDRAGFRCGRGARQTRPARSGHLRAVLRGCAGAGHQPARYRRGLGFVQLRQQLPQERLLLAVGTVVGMEAGSNTPCATPRSVTRSASRCSRSRTPNSPSPRPPPRTRVARVFLDHCIDLHLRGELDITTVSMATV